MFKTADVEGFGRTLSSAQSTLNQNQVIEMESVHSQHSGRASFDGIKFIDDPCSNRGLAAPWRAGYRNDGAFGLCNLPNCPKNVLDGAVLHCQENPIVPRPGRSATRAEHTSGATRPHGFAMFHLPKRRCAMG